MSDDPKKLLEGLGDLDWDSALDEWEKKSFEPAPDPVGAPAAEAKPSEAPAVSRPPAAAPHEEEPISEPRLSSRRPEGTLIAPVPRELRTDSRPAPVSSNPSSLAGQLSSPPSSSSGASFVGAPQPSSPPSIRGGLSQLFSRPRTSPSKLPVPRLPPIKGSSSIPVRPSAPIASTHDDIVDVSSSTRQVELSDYDRLPRLNDEPASDRTVVKAPLTDPMLGAPPLPGESERPVRFDPFSDLEPLSPDEETFERPYLAPHAPTPHAPTGDDEAAETLVRQSVSVSAAASVLSGPPPPPPAAPTSSAAPPVSLGPRSLSVPPPDEDETHSLGRSSGAPPRRSSAVPSPDPTADSLLDSSTTTRWKGDVRRAERRDSQLGEGTGDVFQSRIAWLEEEARSLTDSLGRARALLSVSELCALVGDRERALAFATEARDLAPQLPLAWRQMRQLMAWDPDAVVEALDAEAHHSPTPSARAHATLLAADVLRVNHQGDAAVERWESACKLDPADPRAPISCAALALAQRDHTHAALSLADNSELIALDRAVATALRLRGVERAGAEFDPMPINDGLRHARGALAQGDIVGAAQAVSTIAARPEMASAALWLSSALGTSHIAARRSAARSLKTLADGGDGLARRQLAARGLELGDPELVETALAPVDGPDPFDTAERATLPVLVAQHGAGDHLTPNALSLGSDRALAALEDALLALAPTPEADAPPKDGETSRAVDRAERTAGKPEARAHATLGRLLATRGARLDAIVDAAVREIERPTAPASGVAIEAAVQAKRWTELSATLSNLPAEDGQVASERHVAAAIVAERAGEREQAKAAWSAAARGTASSEGLLRIAADLDRDVDFGAELLRIADEMPDGVGAAVLRLEALARTELDDAESSAILERVHRAAPQLGIGAFLAERIGRRRGDLDEVLRWIQERRSYANGPLETALDSVREALLVADRDPELASSRLEQAHRARPEDVALRELHERLAPDALSDRGTWREGRAERAEGPASLLWIEAALEYERVGDVQSALRVARRAAAAGDRGLSRPLIERCELLLGDTMRQTDELLDVTKNTDDVVVAREAFERLAVLDGVGKKDLGAAMLWHRAILENSPEHKPSLRFVEHALINEGRDDELAPIFELVALALDGTGGGETMAHAQHAARLRAREASATPPADGSSAWERTHDMARLAATQPEPSLWALRTLNAHARLLRDETAISTTTVALLERTQRPLERASLLLRASESAARLDRIEEARGFLEQAVTEDPGDVVTWGFLGEIRERTGQARGAAEACESLARASAVREHQLLAWYDAAKIWQEEKDLERAMSALEAAAEIDVTYADVFPRLSALYADRRLDSELTRLLERRLGTVQDEDERVALEVELARAFAEMGELSKAKVSLGSALEKRPDHTTALSAMSELCSREADWTGAEQAYVRLARLLTDPAEQTVIYQKLGEIYSTHAPNLSRAELAYREVLKRSPGDLVAQTKLVDVLKRQGDVPRAVEVQQAIISATTDPNRRLEELIELAKIHETVGKDPRRSEQVLDGARKEFPTSVVALRAMAEFYARQRQMPAMQILLDRAAGDARRAFGQGRFVPSLFQVLHAAFELRNKRDAAKVVAATLAAVEGRESELMGGEARAVDPRLDDLLAPDTVNPPLRELLVRAGDALDAAMPVDLRTVKATPLPPGTPIGATVGSIATVIGLGALQILVSPTIGRAAIPLSTNPPTLLVGEQLGRVKNERARMFVVVRAMKMILGHSSAMLRGGPQDVSAVVAALLCAFNPGYVAQNVDQKRVADLVKRIGPALGRKVDPTVGVIALEAAGMLGSNWPALAPAAVAWANRVALLAVGDPNAALEALAWGYGEDAAPSGSEERAAWIARHAEARELMTFSVTDAYAEARMRLGLDR